MPTSSLLTRSRDSTTFDGVTTYLRRVYRLKGVPSGSTEEEILAIGNNPDEFDSNDENKVPTPSQIVLGLIRPRYSISMSRRQRGWATVTVTWGRRFVSWGAASGVNSLDGRGRLDRVIQPYMVPNSIAIEGQTEPTIVNETDTRMVNRAVSTIVLTRILSANLTAEQVEGIYLANLNKIYSRGLLTNTRVIERLGTDSIVQTEFTYYGSIRAATADAIEAGSLPVERLPAMAEYTAPVAGTGTGVILGEDLYEEGAELPWL